MITPLARCIVSNEHFFAPRPMTKLENLNQMANQMGVDLRLENGRVTRMTVKALHSLKDLIHAMVPDRENDADDTFGYQDREVPENNEVTQGHDSEEDDE